MSKTTSTDAKDKDSKDPKKDKPADGGWRETVESVAMAIILALLFRGFVAEAFVIPTGSMAPTLMGRHKDVKCPECGSTDTARALSVFAVRGGNSTPDTAPPACGRCGGAPGSCQT